MRRLVVCGCHGVRDVVCVYVVVVVVGIVVVVIVVVVAAVVFLCHSGV